MTLPGLAALASTMAKAEGPFGVAVSGGGDSLALLLLLAKSLGPAAIAAVTVDHGLRPESAEEARGVARLCAARGIDHAILRWEGWDGRGNLQDQARRARRRLIAGWALGRGIGAVALGHTLDDQAETFLLRLARGSGVDGLAAMADAVEAEGIVWLRPLLGVRRGDLRDFLRGEGVGWAEDPGNDDPGYDRVRARRALVLLADLGLGPERLAATAGAMGRARVALDGAVAELARTCLREGAGGDLWLDPSVLGGAAEEVRLRLFAGALGWVSGAVYRPRLASLEAALRAVLAESIGHGLTLHGCVLRPRAGGVVIRREPARAAPPVPAARASWDGRWRLEGPVTAGASIGALGVEGLASCPLWRETGLARETLLTTPALWQERDLLAAPFAKKGDTTFFRRISAISPPWKASLLR